MMEKDKANNKLKEVFMKDVHKGLSSNIKHLPSKYFYDDRGSRLFQQIMNLDEYYLTESELEILHMHDERIGKDIGLTGNKFELVEFGAGDGLKTRVLLEYFLESETPFTYVPIDISEESNERLRREMTHRFPNLDISPINGDYIKTLHRLNRNEKTKVILFLGSNVGNFEPREARLFYRNIMKNLRRGDKILTGFDLIKDPPVIRAAYNDPSGITSAFNLNLLERINRELGGHFVVENFNHYPVYDPVTGAAKSYLVSTREQDVEIDALGRSYHFEEWEPVYMEISQKFNLAMIEQLAKESGFRVIDHYMDKKRYFACSLWELNGQ